MKSCTRCNQHLPLSSFYIRKDGKTEKPSSRCKSCVADASKIRNSSLATMTGARGDAYRSGEKIYASTRACPAGHNSSRWVVNDSCCECVIERDRKRSKEIRSTQERKEYYQAWVKANPGKVLANKARYATSDRAKAKASERFAARYSSDTAFVQKVAARNLLARVVNRMKRSSIEAKHSVLGYSASDLARRMEAQFKTGMSWHNYGSWEIDHKKPVARFMNQGVHDPRLVNMLCNLQPLWKTENRRKSCAFREASRVGRRPV